MRNFFGVLCLLVGSGVFMCGGAVIQSGGGSMGFLLGLLPGGLMLVLGFGLLLGGNSSKKLDATDSEKEKSGQEKSE